MDIIFISGSIIFCFNSNKIPLHTIYCKHNIIISQYQINNIHKNMFSGSFYESSKRRLTMSLR